MRLAVKSNKAAAVEASPQANTPTRSFVDLPLELRDRVYYFALFGPKIYIDKTSLKKLGRRGVKAAHRTRVHGLATNQWTCTIGDRIIGQDQVTSVLAHCKNDVSLHRCMHSPRAWYDAPNVALLRVSREIGDGATQVFYSRNTFSVSPQVHDMNGDVSPAKMNGAAAIAQAFVNFMRSRMHLRHLSLVAWGSTDNYANIFSHGGSRTQPGQNQFQAFSKRARNEVISQVPFVPRLSLTIVWDRTEECPRIRKGLQHDSTCFEPDYPGSSRPKCPVTVNTAISTMWTQSLRKGLLSVDNGPARHDELPTRDIRGRLFRDTDKNFQPSAASNPHGRHYAQLVMETDDHGPAGISKLDTTRPGTQILPVQEPFFGWKVLCDKPVREEDSGLVVRHEETTDAFEVLGGSQNAATSAAMWDLLG